MVGKIDNLEATVNQKVVGLEKRVQVLETELQEEVTKTSKLTGIIVNMQKSINKIDYTERAKNLMVSGLPEEAITTNEGQLTTDVEKFHFILKRIELHEIPMEVCNTFIFERIGKPNNSDRPRIIKVTIATPDHRNAIINKAKSIKQLEDPWKKVYVNKDTHPVYLKETQRIRKRMNEVKQQPGFEHQTGRVKIVKGLLQVDGNTIDKNIFFE